MTNKLNQLIPSIFILLAACAPASDADISATATVSSAAATLSAPTATPTAESFVRSGTPAPDTTGEILGTNIGEVVELARFGDLEIQQKLLSTDRHTLFVLTALDVAAYDAASKEKLWQVDVPLGGGGMALSETLGQLAVGDDAGNITLLDAASGALLKQWYAQAETVSVLAFSEDGEWLASGYYDTANVWRLPDASLAYTIDTSYFGANDLNILGDRLLVNNQIFDLASGSLVYDPNGNLLSNFPELDFIFDITFGYHDFSVGATFADVGLFAVSEEGALSLHSLQTGQEVLKLELEEDEYAEGVAISPDHTRVAAAYFWDTLNIIVWDLATGQRVQEFSLPEKPELTWGYTYCAGDGGGPSYIYSLNFVSNDELAVFTGYSEVVYWNMETDASHFEPWPDSDPALDLPVRTSNGGQLFFSPDGRWLASGENIWDLSSGELRTVPDMSLIGFSLSGISAYAYQDKSILRYRVEDMELRETIPLGEESRDVCSHEKVIAPDGSLFFEGGYSGGDSYESFAWGLTREIDDWLEHSLPDVYRSMYFSADGKLAIVTASDCCGQGTYPDVAGYDLETGDLLFSFYIDGDRWETITGAAISADSSTFAAVTSEKSLVWDLTQPNADPLQLSDVGDYQVSVAVSPHGDLVASESDDGIGIWSTHTGELLTTIRFSADYTSVYALAFSPDGSYLAASASDRLIHLWGIPVEDSNERD